MLILGINAYHGDASACLARNGELVAAAEEERFRRLKHWAGKRSAECSGLRTEEDAGRQMPDARARNGMTRYGVAMVSAEC